MASISQHRRLITSESRYNGSTLTFRLKSLLVTSNA